MEEELPGYVKEEVFWRGISPKIRDELRMQKSVLLRPFVLATLISGLIYWRTRSVRNMSLGLIGLAWVLSIS